VEKNNYGLKCKLGLRH